MAIASAFAPGAWCRVDQELAQVHLRRPLLLCLLVNRTGHPTNGAPREIRRPADTGVHEIGCLFDLRVDAGLALTPPLVPEWGEVWAQPLPARASAKPVLPETMDKALLGIFWVVHRSPHEWFTSDSASGTIHPSTLSGSCEPEHFRPCLTRLAGVGVFHVSRAPIYLICPLSI